MSTRHKLKSHIKNAIRDVVGCNVVHLYNKDFERGTYRVSKPGKYILMEDIIFDPNSDNNGSPTHEQLQGDYNHSAYFLGFFAGITIESSYVEIALNGHTIKQGKFHALQQRFFQTIQLNDSPFLKTEGPSGSFANSGFKPTEYIWIHRGRIGLSSHYSIHGNNNSHVLIEHVKMSEFETGGIALNGVKNLVITKSVIGPIRTNTPVTALYSVLRNLILILRNPKMYHYMNHEFKGMNGHCILKKLLKLEKIVIKNYRNSKYNYVTSRKEDKYNREIREYIYNKTGINDGSSIVGIQITPKGVAVNSFEEKVCPGSNSSCKPTDDNYSRNIFINALTIDKIEADPVEIVSCKEVDKNIVGGMGELVNVYNIIDENYKYRPTIINNATFWLAKLYNHMKTSKDKLPVSTIFIPETLINWAEKDQNLMSIDHKLVLRYGLDIMGHVNKGVMGLRIGGTIGVNLTNIKIRDIKNSGKKSKVNSRPKYGDNYIKEKNNVSEELGFWYSGNVAYGIVFSTVKEIKIKNLNIYDIRSVTGEKFDYFYNETNKKDILYLC